MKVREFLKANSLKQVALARYLGVTEAAISNVAKGKSDFSEDNLIKLINNPHGWDVSMLTGDSSEDVKPEIQEEPSNSLLEYLQRKVAELERKVEKLNDEKAELLQENAVLRYENRIRTPRKGDAESAESSLSADVV